MNAAGWYATVVGAAALWFTLPALWVVWGRARRERPATPPEGAPPFAVMIPCERLSGPLARTLARGVPWAAEVLVAAPPSAHDVRDAVDAARARGVPARFVASEPPAGVNRKVWHLARASEASRLGVLVQADDDAVLEPAALAGVLASLLADPANGAAFAPVFVRAGSPGGRAAAESAMVATPQAIAVAAAMTDMAGGAAPMVGTLAALRREALEAVGGYGALLYAIGEDLHAAALLHGAGWRVVASAARVETDEPALTFVAFARQLARWVRVAVRHRPALAAAYPVFIAPLATVLPAALASRAPAALATAAALYATRVALAAATRRAMGAPATASVAWHVVLGDALVLGAWAASAAGGRSVVWHGRRYAIGAGGIIVGAGPEGGAAP